MSASASIVTLPSENARVQWGSTLDQAYVERKDVIISRFGRPIVAMINYLKWQELNELQKRVRYLEGLLLSRQRNIEMQTDPSQVIVEDEYQAMLAEAGLTE